MGTPPYISNPVKDIHGYPTTFLFHRFIGDEILFNQVMRKRTDFLMIWLNYILPGLENMYTKNKSDFQYRLKLRTVAGMPPSAFTNFISSFHGRWNNIEPGHGRTRPNFEDRFCMILFKYIQRTFYFIVLWAMEYFRTRS